jgi:hypothetical protein
VHRLISLGSCACLFFYLVKGKDNMLFSLFFLKKKQQRDVCLSRFRSLNMCSEIKLGFFRSKKPFSTCFHLKNQTNTLETSINYFFQLKHSLIGLKTQSSKKKKKIFSNKLIIKKHINRTHLVKWNSLTSIIFFFIVRIWPAYHFLLSL